MHIEVFYDALTFTLTYLVYDQNTKDAVVIDPVLDYDPDSSTVSHTSLEKLEAFIKGHQLNLQWVLETHAHADHLSSSQLLKKRYPQLKLAIGHKITKVQEVFKDVFNFTELKTDGSQFDRLLKEGDILEVGPLKIQVIETPGHTPACVCYLVEDALFTGDALFMHDYGTGRCDFPAGDARDLYHSIHQKLYRLPDSTRVFVGHDYQPGGREVRWESSIGQEKKANIQLKEQTSEEEFVRFRQERDQTLKAPKLLLPSVQVNIQAGHFPRPEGNGISYLKLPIRSP